MPRKEALSANINPQTQQNQASDGMEKFELPRTLVTKISKSTVSPNIKLQKEVVMSLVKGSTVFINYVMATAHDVAISKQHKSISASDVMKALEVLQFKDISDIIQPELDVYRELAKTDKSRRGTSNLSAAKAAAAAASASATAPPGGASATTSAGKSKATKGKGKAKESTANSTSASTPVPPPAPPAVPGSGGVDPSLLFGSGAREDSDAMDVDRGEGEEEEEEEMDEGDGERGEVVDTMAVEEEELKQDARMLDGAAGGHTPGEDHS